MRGVIRIDDQISAFHAYALARQGKIADAEATLKIAWAERVIGPAHLAAEAALAVAAGDEPAVRGEGHLAGEARVGVPREDLLAEAAEVVLLLVLHLLMKNRAQAQAQAQAQALAQLHRAHLLQQIFV